MNGNEHEPIRPIHVDAVESFGEKAELELDDHGYLFPAAGGAGAEAKESRQRQLRERLRLQGELAKLQGWVAQR